MAKNNNYSRRSFLPILGSSFLLPFIGRAKEIETEQKEDDDYQILLKPDGTPVRVKKSALRKAMVKKKNISNKSFLKWLGKKL